MKILVINGPNINMLGIREPDIYGKETFSSLEKKIKAHCKARGIRVKLFQSNCEGKIVSEIQKAYKKFDGIVINPAAYTHTSVAILDALKDGRGSHFRRRFPRGVPQNELCPPCLLCDDIRSRNGRLYGGNRPHNQKNKR